MLEHGQISYIYIYGRKSKNSKNFNFWKTKNNSILKVIWKICCLMRVNYSHLIQLLGQSSNENLLMLGDGHV